MRGFAPLFLLLFAGGFMLFSVTILDRYFLKNPNSQVYLAKKTNPVVTSKDLADNPGCAESDEDDPAECAQADEGDGISSNQLAVAD